MRCKNINRVAVRTFTAGHEQLRGAALTTLRRMAITVKSDESVENGNTKVTRN